MSKNIIAEALLEIADGIESGSFAKKPKIGLTILGSEHGLTNMLEAANLAKSINYEIILIGPKVETEFELVEVSTEEEAHNKMEELLDSKYIDACVTMHYSFPIGVSTIGRVITPGVGKEMLIATTTGTSSTNRVEGMVKNTIAGISVAKALGRENPTVGILNVDGAKQVEKALNNLKSNGYKFEYGESARSDGGAVLRGNDLLQGVPDVCVTDSLTGNILMKMFSAFTTGGSYESLGYGYGPGIGEGYDRTIMIISRASGAPVIANAIKYAFELVIGNIKTIAEKEYKEVNSHKFKEVLESLTAKKVVEDSADVKAPPQEIVTGSITGIDILDLEDAVTALWKNNIYAESGMGCTGPIVMVNEKNVDKATDILKTEDFL
ncbi:glycine/sarcosine/betaine reductase complex component C subunit alpha [Miniphocaeibacter halophilus]|uniref:Glycine reductase n=1 Tax=Miniphocaeibacter halophilus TaxID=2931922 RepID=A0AC61MSQ2_9FIRM|nr:glycine/sarcosine/betaine reductase complex component C subunit alpha [Miniphocaeibacter halophilus]QQK08694.1 glycine reductase [Miniphocaeibacter halophilus]